MDLVSLIFVAAIAGAILYFLLGSNREKNLPPGPSTLPIIGNIHQIDRNTHIYKTFTNFSKQYGKLVSVKLGTIRTIVLNDPKLIREAFNMPALSGRPTNKVFNALSEGGYGVIFVEGDDWTEQRRFTLKHLRNFGFGKNKMETLILDEAKELIEGFKNENGQAFDPTHRFNLAVLNSLWIIMTGSRFTQDDQEINKILTNYFRQLDATFVESTMSLYPILSTIIPEWSGYNKLTQTIAKTWEFFQGVVTEHKNTVTDEEPRDYIDAYLQEIKKNKDDPKSSFTGDTGDRGYKHLLAILGDLFAAGAETTSTTLSWSVLYLAVFPEKQKKLQDEIDLVIGQTRLPSLADRPNMPYTEAVMYEVLRFSSILGVGLIHKALEDVEFHGYTIPKDAYVMANLHLSHHGTEYWDEPEAFRPERFLVTGENGQVKVQRNENLMPFSVGKRACLGESLARDEFFLFLTTIYQRFDVHLDPNSKKPELEAPNSLLARPKSFKVVMKER